MGPVDFIFRLPGLGCNVQPRRCQMPQPPTNIRPFGSGPSSEGDAVGSFYGTLLYAADPSLETLYVQGKHSSEAPSSRRNKSCVRNDQLLENPPDHYYEGDSSHSYDLRSITHKPGGITHPSKACEESYIPLVFQGVSHPNPEQDIKAARQPAPLLHLQVRDASNACHNEAQGLIQRYIEASHNKCLKSHHKSSGEGLYHCTSGCGYTTKRKDDWRRHEEINHPQNFWICSCCPAPLKSAFLTHRRDKLNDHVKKVHKGANLSIIAQDSKIEFNAGFYPRCGFCGRIFETWARRNSHIISHFESGFSGGEWTMSHWRNLWSEDDVDGSDGSDDDTEYEWPHPGKDDVVLSKTPERDASSLSPQAPTPSDRLDHRDSPRSPTTECLPMRHTRLLDLESPQPSLVVLCNRLRDQFGFNESPHMVNHFFEIWESVFNGLARKGSNDPTTNDFAKHLTRLCKTLSQDRQSLEIEPSEHSRCLPDMELEGPTSALSQNSENKSKYDHVANTIFRYSLHRSLIDFQQFPFNNLAASRPMDSESGINNSESFNTL